VLGREAASYGIERTTAQSTHLAEVARE
jgi:hypothetical protein